MPSSARCAGAATLIAVALAGCSDDPGPATAPPSSPPSSPSTPAAGTPSTVPAADVAQDVDDAVAAATTATVRIQASSTFTLQGTADFTGAVPSLVGDLDWSDSDVVSHYAARDLHVTLRVPPGEQLSRAHEASAANPWGRPVSAIDPQVVSALLRTRATNVLEAPSGDGRRVIAHLDSAAMATAIGLEVPDNVEYDFVYRIEFDAQDRLSTISLDLDRFGGSAITFTDWQ